jgi:hypothetical protein
MISVKASNEDVHLKENVKTELSLAKYNYKFLEGEIGDKYLVYTYESNGSKFKVVEESNDSFTKVESKIYKKDELDNFEEYAQQVFEISNSMSILTTIVNNNIEVEKQNFDLLDNLSTSSFNIGIEKETINSIKDINSIKGSNGIYNGYEVTSWLYQGVTKSSVNVSSYTITAVSSLLFHMVTKRFSGEPLASVISVVSGITTTIITNHISVIFYERFYYEKKLVNPPFSLQNFVVGSKWSTYIYEDPYHNQLVGHTIDEVYQTGYAG